MKRVAILISAGLLAGCAGDTAPPDAAVWRSQPVLGETAPKALSPEEYFAQGNPPYEGLCGRMVTKASEACTPEELEAMDSRFAAAQARVMGQSTEGLTDRVALIK